MLQLTNFIEWLIIATSGSENYMWQGFVKVGICTDVNHGHLKKTLLIYIFVADHLNSFRMGESPKATCLGLRSPLEEAFRIYNLSKGQCLI